MAILGKNKAPQLKNIPNGFLKVGDTVNVRDISWYGGLSIEQGSSDLRVSDKHVLKFTSEMRPFLGNTFKVSQIISSCDVDGIMGARNRNPDELYKLTDIGEKHVYSEGNQTVDYYYFSVEMLELGYRNYGSIL